MTQPSSVLKGSGSRAHEALHDTQIMRCEHGWPRPPRSQNRRSASSMPSPATPTTAAATTPTSGSVPTSWPRCCRPPRLCSHHLQPKLPNPATERGSVDVSFSGGHKVGSRLKRCLPGVNPRCVLVGGRSSRDILSTLPARRADLRGFTRSVTRMYRLCSSASCVTHRVLTGT